MATGDKYTNFTLKRLASYQDFKDRFLDYLREGTRQMGARVYSTDGTFNGAIVGFTASGNDEFDLDTGKPGTDGNGHILNGTAEFFNDIQFENANTIVYYVGCHYAERPLGIQINPRTGLPEFTEWEEIIGEAGTPDTAVDNGSTMTFRVDSITEAGVSNAGRTVLVYKKVLDPNALTYAIAAEECTVTWTGTNNEITTSAQFGQTTPSTTVGDYEVVLLGPRVSRNTDLEPVSEYWFIGTVTGAGAGSPPSTFNTVNQNSINTGLAVNLNDITRTSTNGDTKLHVRANALDADEAQFSIADSGGVNVATLDEDGDLWLAGGAQVDGDLDVAQDATVAGDITVSGAVKADGGIQRSVAGTLVIGADANTSQVDVGKTGAVVEVQGKAASEEGALFKNAVNTIQLGNSQIGTSVDIQAPLAIQNNSLTYAGGDPLTSTFHTYKHLVLGESLKSTLADAILARAAAAPNRNASATWTLMLDLARDSASSYNGVRVYTHKDGRFAITINCSWDNTNWSEDVAGQDALQLVLRRTRVELKRKDGPSAATWNDSSWDNTLVDLDIGSATTGTGIGTFKSTLEGLGETRLQDLTNALSPRLSAAYTDDAAATLETYTNLAKIFMTGKQTFNVYAATSDDTGMTHGLMLCVNAQRNAAENWSAPLTTMPSFRVKFNAFADTLGPSDIIVHWRAPGGGTWVEAGWTLAKKFALPESGSSRTLDQRQDPIIEGLSCGTGTGTSNPASSDAIKNKITMKNTLKAFAIISVTSGVPTIVDGFNVASIVASATKFTLTLAQGMDSTALHWPYATGTSNSSIGAFWRDDVTYHANASAGNAVEVTLRDDAGAVVVPNDGATALVFAVWCYGVQT